MTVGKQQDPFSLHTADNGVVTLRLNEWLTSFPWLTAGFTTRKGGVGQKPWDELNTALHVGDHTDAVIENRRLVSAAAGLAFDAWTCAEQVHGCDAAVVDAASAGSGRLSREDAIQGKDVLVTNTPGVMLTMFYADCVPLWFVDPVNRAVGLAHAGWRGSVAGAASEAVRTMQREFSSSPDELRAAIGPSIRGCCYEVDENIAQHFKQDPSECLSPSSSPGRYMLDLAKFNRHKLTEAGILPKHIEISDYCTSCQTDLFFSHRKEKGSTGRMAAWIAVTR